MVFHSEVGVLLAALMIPLLHVRMQAEEALLRVQFGSEYEAYYRRIADCCREFIAVRPIG